MLKCRVFGTEYNQICVFGTEYIRNIIKYVCLRRIYNQRVTSEDPGLTALPEGVPAGGEKEYCNV